MAMPDLGTALGGSDPRATSRGPQPPPRTGHTGPRRSWLLPVLVLIGFIAVFAWATWERWLPATPVEVVRIEAVKQRGAVTAAPEADTVAFQAAGWLEADPFPVHATALVSGVVTEVPVVQGETVERGQVLARLDPADFELALREAQARREEIAADLAAAETRIAVIEAERARLQARVASQEAVVAERADQAERLAGAGRAVSAGSIEQARLRRRAAEQDLAALQSEVGLLDARRAEAEARVAQQRAARSRQAVAVEQAALALERTSIRAPITGVIQRLHAVPGRKQMLGSDAPTSTTVATLFDPSRVQVRVDVALADAGGLFVGQRARISTEIWPDRTFAGVVTRIEGHADITRNTLQAKVRVVDPDPLMRPEMLCRVQFLARQVSAATEGPTEGGERLQLLLPAAVVAGAPGERATLWFVDEHDRAERREVELGARYGEAIEIRGGAPAGALVIVDPPADLAAGDPVSYEEARP